MGEGEEGEEGGREGSVGGSVGGNSCTHVPACSSSDRVRGGGGGGADDKLPSAGTLRLTATVTRADVETCGDHRRDISPGKRVCGGGGARTRWERSVSVRDKERPVSNKRSGTIKQTNKQKPHSLIADSPSG